MQNQAMALINKSFVFEVILHHGFVLLWKCQLFFDELERYDKMSKAMRREDRLRVESRE